MIIFEGLNHSMVNITANKKIYFLSDFHLGVPDTVRSLARERKIVRCLSLIEKDAAEVFLVGDLFDFWFEYKRVVPKGYTRLLGKLAEMSDAGIKLHFFVGNHDMWIRDYFQLELGMKVYFEPTYFTFNGKRFLVGHGDGQGPGDHSYKFLKKIFRNKICQSAFGMIPSSWGIGIANYFSRKSRLADKSVEEKFQGEDKEWLIVYSKEILEKEKVDYFIFGHRHLPIEFDLNATSKYVNLGEWINYSTYACFDGDQLTLKEFLDQ